MKFRLKRKKPFGFATFDPRNGFVSVSLIVNQNTAFSEQISDRCYLLYQDSKREILVGCWIKETRDIVVKVQFFQKSPRKSPRTVGQLLDLLINCKKSSEIFGDSGSFLKLVNHEEIRKLQIVLV